MHPLAIFPQLFFLGLLAPFLLRLSVGLFLIYLGSERHKKIHNWSATIYVLSGILLVLGLYTQIAAIVGIFIVVFDFYLEKKLFPLSLEKKILYAIVAIILVSLLLTGPGFLAFDLPL